MFGIQQFGEPLFAGSSVLSEYIPTEDFTFNTYGLQNSGQYGIHISRFDITSPTRGFKTTEVPGNHGLILQEDWFRDNPITLQGWISANSRENLENKVHEFMRNIHGQGGNLIIKNGGNFKSIKTTMQSANFVNEHYSICKKEFSVMFSGIKSFWQDLVYTTEAVFGNTSLVVNGNMNNSGSVETDPIIIIIFDSATAISEVLFKNTTNGEEVKISEPISAGDVVIFDSEEKKVTINNVEVEYSGRFPILQVGLNSITIEMIGTSASTDITAKHKNQYLTP